MSDFIYKRKTEKDIKKLQKIVDLEENETSIDRLIALDVKFHETLFCFVIARPHFGNRKSTPPQTISDKNPIFTSMIENVKSWKK